MSNIAIRLHAFVSMLVADLKKERGQDLLEYVILGGGIAAALVAGFFFFSDDVATMLTNIGDCIDFDNSSACNPGW
jgi:Flp pilus assembly pilin Flp